MGGLVLGRTVGTDDHLSRRRRRVSNTRFAWNDAETMGPGNRPLDLAWLEDFAALAESGNFTRAAEARTIAQPAFSRHIRALEEWAGVALVDRSSHPTVLTPAGRRILPLLKDVVAGLEAARIKARIAHDQAAASLRLACTHALSLTFFPRWLASVEARLQPGPIQTMSDHYQACEDLMLQRRVQFMLCHGHAAVPERVDDGTYPVVRLGEDVLLPVSVPDRAGAPLFSLERLEVLPTLEYSEGSRLGRIVRGVFRDLLAGDAARAAGPTLSAVFTAHDARLLRRMALDGRGLAWLPRTLIEDALADRRLLEAGGARWQVPVEIRLYRQPARMAEVAESLWRVASGD
jgi:DNA-binding transcriptional LysR family regulator